MTEKESLMDLEYKKRICELDLSHWESKLKLKKEFDLDCSDIFGYRTECLNRLSWLGEQIEEYKQQEELKKEKGVELKTLNDLTHYFGYMEEAIISTDSNELKLEAIKWIKDETQGYPDIYNTVDDLEAIKRWIKHFFNISEEDLKEVEGR